jgi:PKD repeat protein
VPGGTYYLSIDGVGAGDLTTGYSDYGSLGAYALSGTVIPTTGQAPIASVAQTTPKTGTVPLSVAFSSNGSYDPDGTITSFRWDFGDGSAPDTTANPVHVYQRTGTFTASLVVTDNSGLTATASTTIVVSADTRMHLSLITLTASTSSRGTQVTARITVVDSAGKPVSNATVSGAWSGVLSKSVSAKTGSTGVASFVSALTKSKGVLTFTVTNVSKTGLVYTPTQNVMTSASITLP